MTVDLGMHLHPPVGHVYILTISICLSLFTVVIHDAGSRWVDRVISFVCDFVCVSALQKENGSSYQHQP